MTPIVNPATDQAEVAVLTTAAALRHRTIIGSSGAREGRDQVAVDPACSPGPGRYVPLTDPKDS
jgi:hypothetical protein